MFFARALSVLLHPLLMPLITLWLVLIVDPKLAYFLPTSRVALYGMLGMMTVVFPIISSLLLMRAGVLSNLEMPTRQERIAPYVMTLMYFGMAYYLLRRTPLHPTVHAIFFGILIALAATLLITFWWKISAHMVGMGGVIGALLGLSIIHALPLLPLIALLVLLAGLLGTARLLTSDHTQGQIIAGVALGWCCTQGTLTLGLWI